MSKYEQLRARINELLPDRARHFCCKYKTITPEDYCDHCLNNGKPLTIEDVLRAMNLQGDTRYENIVAKGHILKVSVPTGKSETFLEDKGDQYESGVNYTWTDFCIDLSLPLSAEENSEACAAVLELLK